MHTCAEISGLNVKMVNDVYDSIFVVPVTDLFFAYERVREFSNPVFVPAPPGGPVNITVANPGPQPAAQVGEFILIEEGGLKEIVPVTAVVVGVGTDMYTVPALTQAFTLLAKVYTLKVYYDKLVVVDPNPVVLEETTLSVYGNWRDQMVFRLRYAQMSLAEFNFMLSTEGEPPVGAVTPGAIEDWICEVLFQQLMAIHCEDWGVEGEGAMNPGIRNDDGGAFVSHSCATFEDQFEDFSGSGTFDEYIFEVPFDTYLTRASIHTNASTAADAYVTIHKNDVIPIVDAGPVPPNRNLPAVTGVIKGVDLPNIPVVKGDKITVRLNLPTLNTIQRANVVIAHAPRLVNL
jgi:hypothetical protein